MNENLKKAFKKNGTVATKNLVIRHIPTRIEYTINQIVFKGGKPCIVAYRYYSKPGSEKKVFITIPDKDFKDYERI